MIKRKRSSYSELPTGHERAAPFRAYQRVGGGSVVARDSLRGVEVNDLLAPIIAGNVTHLCSCTNMAPRFVKRGGMSVSALHDPASGITALFESTVDYLYKTRGAPCACVKSRVCGQIHNTCVKYDPAVRDLLECEEIVRMFEPQYSPPTDSVGVMEFIQLLLQPSRSSMNRARRIAIAKVRDIRLGAQVPPTLRHHVFIGRAIEESVSAVDGGVFA